MVKELEENQRKERRGQLMGGKWKWKRIAKLRKPLLALAVSFAIASGTAFAAPILSLNSHGHDVMILQQQLKSKGYLSSKPDGIFGKDTQKAVRNFQEDNKISPTGIVDRATWNALKDAKEKKQPSQSSDAKPSKAAKVSTLPKGKAVPESKPFLSQAQAASIVKTAKKYIGVPYSFGGTTPKAFDCSGYLQYVFRENGLSIPRTADEQFKLGKNMPSGNLQPGDLVFFTTYEAGASHCGIYLGKGEFIHASSSKGVRIDKLSDGYWKPRYYGGKHIINN